MNAQKNNQAVMTGGAWLALILVLAMIGAAIYRLSAGLGAVTNLSDDVPWGLWVGVDVMKIAFVVRDPVRRTELCLSCHLGSTSENKMVTHAMYAAGHPPLPGFEMETLRFLFTTSFYPPYSIGGDATHVKYLAEELAREGHEVHVVHSIDAYRAKRKDFFGVNNSM